MLVEVTRERYSVVMRGLAKYWMLNDVAMSTRTMSVMDTYCNGKLVGRATYSPSPTYYLDDSVNS